MNNNIASVAIEAVAVSSDLAATVARIVDINDATRSLEAEGKRLKAEVIEAVGGAEMVAVFDDGIRVTHDGTVIATVKSTTRTTVTTDALTAGIQALLAAFPDVATVMPELASALAALPATVSKTTVYPVVRPK
jgi:hypothetical protein